MPMCRGGLDGSTMGKNGMQMEKGLKTHLSLEPQGFFT